MSMNEKVVNAKFFREFCDTAANMYRLGWDERNGGNISLMLDDATAAKFTPVYQAYQKEMRECRLPRLKKKSNEMTDEEIAQEIERQFTQGRKVIDVKEMYYKEFKKILTMKQIREVYRLERFNMRRMGKEINRRQGMKPRPMPGKPFGKEMQ